MSKKEMTLEQLLLEVVWNTSIDLIKNAGEIKQFEWKQEYDPVTELDRKAEQKIKKEVLKYLPANFFGEEFGVEDNGATHTFYIDPIDGTKSYLRGEFESCISIGVEKERRIIGGIVYDFMRHLSYVRTDRPLKIFYENREIYPNKNDFGKERILFRGSNFNLSRLLRTNSGFSIIKKPGSMALQMAHVAAGIYDGIFSFEPNKGHVWDVIAGYHLLADEFNIYDMYGNEFDYKNPQLGMVVFRKDSSLNLKEIMEGFYG